MTDTVLYSTSFEPDDGGWTVNGGSYTVTAGTAVLVENSDVWRYLELPDDAAGKTVRVTAAATDCEFAVAVYHPGEPLPYDGVDSATAPVDWRLDDRQESGRIALHMQTSWGQEGHVDQLQVLLVDAVTPATPTTPSAGPAASTPTTSTPTTPTTTPVTPSDPATPTAPTTPTVPDPIPGTPDPIPDPGTTAPTPETESYQVTEVRWVQRAKDLTTREMTWARKRPDGTLQRVRWYRVHTEYKGLLFGHGAPTEGLTHAYVDQDTGTLYVPDGDTLGVDGGHGTPPDGFTGAWLDEDTGTLYVPQGSDPHATLAGLTGAPAVPLDPYVDTTTGTLYLTRKATTLL